jgi:hypothetical protein
MMAKITISPNNNNYHGGFQFPYTYFSVVFLLLTLMAGICTSSALVPIAMNSTMMFAIPMHGNLQKLLQLRRVILLQRHWRVVKGIVLASRVDSRFSETMKRMAQAVTGWKDSYYRSMSIETHYLSIEYEAADADGKTMMHVQKELNETIIKHASWLTRTLVCGQSIKDPETYQLPANGSEIDILVLPGLSKSGIQRQRHLDERRGLILECVLNAIIFSWVSLIAAYSWYIASRDTEWLAVLNWAAMSTLLGLTLFIGQCAQQVSLGETILEKAMSDEEVLNEIDSNKSAA